jgi:CheY-like chemotaxis protein
VEDEALVGLDLADMLEELGHDVVGPFMTSATALSACRFASIDFAVLDFNLGTQTSEPLADALVEREIPFAFLTGYRQDSLPEGYRNFVLLQKPVHLPALRRAMDAAAAQRF